LNGAYLNGANLRGADLRWANLSGAFLNAASLSEANLPHFQIPQEEELIVWKKGHTHLIKLRIPPEAKRTASLVGRKCRAEFAEVLEIRTPQNRKAKTAKGWHDQNFGYKVGETVHPDKYDPDIRVECSHGIHFFLTREDAEEF
jgi:hypothetical protein